MALAAEDHTPEVMVLEGLSQMVAKAMVPIRQEIIAGIRETNRRLDSLDGRVERLEADMAEVKTRLDAVEKRLDGIESTLAKIAEKLDV